MSRTYDAIVLGLGGMGSAAAYELARRGRRVLGLDRLRPPHTRGSSHGKSRAIRQAYFEDPAYLPLLLRAYELWERLERESGSPLLTRTGCLMLGAEDSQVVAGSLRTAREHGLDHELLDAAALRRRYPPFSPAPGTVALFEAAGGILKPEASIEAHLGLAQRLGAELRFDEPVEGWEAKSDAVSVHTASGTFEAGRLVVAAGAWSGPLLAAAGLPLSVPLAVRRKVLVWLEPRSGVDAYLPERFPVWIWETAPDEVVYGFPALDGPGGGAKVGLHTGGEPCTAETVDRELHDADVEAVRNALGRSAPDLSGELLRGCACLYTDTPDGHFVLGEHPEEPRVLVAAGFSGHGFKFAGVVAEALADLAIDGSTTHPVGLFAPERFAASQSGAGASA